MNKYLEYKNRQQAEFSKLPIKAAFGNQQFEEMMAEWGLTTSKEDLAKIAQLGAGCYCLKEDYPKFIQLGVKHAKEDEEYFKNDENFKEALFYEFANHECMLTMNPWEALGALSFTEEEILNDKRLYKLFKTAWNLFKQSRY